MSAIEKVPMIRGRLRELRQREHEALHHDGWLFCRCETAMRLRALHDMRMKDLARASDDLARRIAGADAYARRATTSRRPLPVTASRISLRSGSTPTRCPPTA